MKRNMITSMILLVMVLMLSACGSSETEKPVDSQVITPEQSEVISQNPQESSSSENEDTGKLEKVVLKNTDQSAGNYNASFSHFDFNLTYNDDFVIIINWESLYYHGKDISSPPVRDISFSQKALEPKMHEGKMYYLVEDGYTSNYYLYSWDFINQPVKMTDQKVYTFMIVNNQIIFTEDFVQGPLFSLNLADSTVSQLTQNRVHNFTSDGKDVYYKSTDVGNAPGLVRYDMITKEETIAVFPFFSSNYLVLGNDVYYEEDSNGKRNIIRQSLEDQSLVILKSLDEYTITLNISDGELYIQTESNISTCHLDGTESEIIYEGNDLKRGNFIIGNRIYFADYNSRMMMIDKDGTNFTELLFED
ncbi:MAG: DUF5050 domain-containing protein [Clostridia bacterium]|nr:DUF5050 domain-containing protein [Clostridia bacterium]